jgi:membrane-associated phospholipid phosphatase
VKTQAEPDAIALRPHRLYWWKEGILIVGFYLIYSFIRNQFGSARLGPTELPTHAFDNAMRVIRWEEMLSLFRERQVQQAFLDHRTFLRFWNIFYGSAHFIVTIAAFILMYRHRRKIFPKWRNCILATTAVALIGFALFPVMPPRLLDQPRANYGGLEIQQQRGMEPFGFVDTLAEVGGLWSFDEGTVAKLSNQYAAMPSLHCAWAAWCAIVAWYLTKRRLLRALAVIYPFLTLFCIIVTGNHYWIDGIGGLIVLGAGFLIGSSLDRWNTRRIERLHQRRLATLEPAA